MFTGHSFWHYHLSYIFVHVRVIFFYKRYGYSLSFCFHFLGFPSRESNLGQHDDALPLGYPTRNFTRFFLFVNTVYDCTLSVEAYAVIMTMNFFRNEVLCMYSTLNHNEIITGSPPLIRWCGQKGGAWLGPCSTHPGQVQGCVVTTLRPHADRTVQCSLVGPHMFIPHFTVVGHSC